MSAADADNALVAPFADDTDSRMTEKKRLKFSFLPLTVSLETVGGIATPLVMRGGPLPAKRTQTFSTAEDNQTSVTLHLTIGERPLAKDNSTLGKVDLEGIPEASQGTPQIAVNVEIDRKCLLSVSAVETTSGNSLDVKLDQPDILLDQDRIQEFLDNAERHRDEDQDALRSIEIRNEARKVLAEAESVVSAMPNSAIEKCVAGLGLALQNDDDPAIQSAITNLKNRLTSVSTPDIFGDVFADIFGDRKSARTRYRTGSGTVESQEQPKSEQARGGSARQPVSTAHSQLLNLGKIFGGGEFTLDPTLCFVLMPFSSPFQGVFNDHIKLVVEGESLACVRADEIVGTQQITRDIWEHIHRARFLIADLTGKNANVFYELGLAHAIGKKVILLTQTMDDVPFDLRAVRCLIYAYTPPGMKNLEQRLRRTIRELMNSEG